MSVSRFSDHFLSDYIEIIERKIFSDNLWTAVSPLLSEEVDTSTTIRTASVKSVHQLDLAESILIDTFCDYNLALLELNKWLHYYQEQNIIPLTLSHALGSKDFISAVQEFVTRILLANDDSLDLYDVYHNTDDRIPFICSFTHFDVDPLSEILSLASEIGLPEDAIKCVPFSTTRVLTELEKIVLDALKEGKWILVHDFHVLKYAADDMISLLNQISAIDDVHSQFKLWIISFLDEELPIAVLLKGIKITMRDRKYLGPMLHQLYSFTSVQMPHLFENQKLDRNWNFHFFLVCFCHAVLKTVQNHGNFFLQKSCDFTKMNFRSSCSFLELFFVNDEQDTFIEDFIYLLSECNYGANFSGETDQLMLETIVGSLRVEKSDRPSFVEILDVRFTIPRDMSFNACIRFIQSLPKTNLLEESNLYHLLTLEQIQSTVDFWKLARKLYCFNEQEDENLMELMKDDVFLALNIVDHWGEYVGSSKSFTNIYLKQEIALYRTLVECIISTFKCRKNKRRIKFSSKTKMSAIAQKLQNNEIPPLWSPWSYPFTHSLKTYILNLNKRLIFLNKWIHYDQPKIVWLSGLFNVLGFLTSVRYIFSKHCNAFLSDVSLFAEVTNFEVDATTSEEWEIFHQKRKNQNPFGVFIRGLFLIGGSWNREKQTIDAEVHENYCHILPVVWIAPKIHRKDDLDEDVYSCPLYYTRQTGSQQLQFRFSNYITQINLMNSVQANRTITKKGIRLVLYSD